VRGGYSYDLPGLQQKDAVHEQQADQRPDHQNTKIFMRKLRRGALHCGNSKGNIQRAFGAKIEGGNEKWA
jgi:hypothetical protein